MIIEFCHGFATEKDARISMPAENWVRLPPTQKHLGKVGSCEGKRSVALWVSCSKNGPPGSYQQVCLFKQSTRIDLAR